jgi:hypothetical protein
MSLAAGAREALMTSGQVTALTITILGWSSE